VHSRRCLDAAWVPSACADALSEAHLF